MQQNRAYLIFVNAKNIFQDTKIRNFLIFVMSTIESQKILLFATKFRLTQILFVQAVKQRILKFLLV